MGIAGLQTYMKKSCPESVEPCNILEKAKKYKKRTGQKPLLIIDGSNCCRPMYMFATLADDSFSSCRLKAAVDNAVMFLENLQANGIEIMVYFDGSPKDERVEIAKERGLQTFRAVKEVFEICATTGRLPTSSMGVDPRSMLPYKEFKLCFQSRIKSLKIPCIETTIHVDEEILYSIRENGCFGILTQDSDFIIPKEFLHVFSVENLNPVTLDTTCFRRDLLENHLNLRSWQLPYFATACGNDIVSRDSLRDFHNSLLRRHSNYHRLKYAKFLPAVLLLPTVAKWLRKELDDNFARTDLPEYIAEAVGLASAEEDFKKSILSYIPSYKEPVDPTISEDMDEEWTALVIKAKERVEKGFLFASCYSILTRGQILMRVTFQMYDDPEYPCDNILLEPFLSRMYGVLLKERPEHCGGRVFTEVSVKGDKHEDKVIETEIPTEHPGLLRLWSDNCPAEEKWNMLCWIVCPDLKPEDVLEMPEELRVPGMAIFYLKSAIKKLGTRINECHVEALVVTAVKMLSVTKEELSTQVDWFDPVAVHWGSVYQSICFDIYNASGICGNPSSLYQYPDYVFFDSNVYGVYKDIESGEKNPRELCKNNNDILNAYDKVKSFLTKYELF